MWPWQAKPARAAARSHIVIPTHTTRHLGACLAAMAWQTQLPGSIVVTCDTDSRDIARVLDEVWPETAATREMPPLFHTWRPHQGEARLNQARNNGLRALESAGVLGDEDQVIILDGDTILHPEAVRLHTSMARQGYEMVIPYRLNLSEEVSRGIDANAVLADRGRHLPLRWMDPEALQDLAARESRYRRHLIFRRLGLTKPHKAKVLGGHHAVSVRVLRAVNGYDEGYVGYGYDDDDLSRRVHGIRPRVKTGIAVREIPAFHLWHATRAPSRPTQAPGYARFKRGGPVVAEHGWRSPSAQPAPECRVVGAASPVQTG